MAKQTKEEREAEQAAAEQAKRTLHDTARERNAAPATRNQYSPSLDNK